MILGHKYDIFFHEWWNSLSVNGRGTLMSFSTFPGIGGMAWARKGQAGWPSWELRGYSAPTRWSATIIPAEPTTQPHPHPWITRSLPQAPSQSHPSTRRLCLKTWVCQVQASSGDFTVEHSTVLIFFLLWSIWCSQHVTKHIWCVLLTVKGRHIHQGNDQLCSLSIPSLQWLCY